MFPIQARILFVVSVLASANCVSEVIAFDRLTQRGFFRRAFSPVNNLRATASTPQDRLHDEPAESGSTEADGDGEDNRSTLMLRGESSVVSNPLPRASDEMLVEFFKAPACRNLLLSGGGERPCSEVDVTPELFDHWKLQCVSLGARQPVERDCILSVLTRGIQFPGLRVTSNVSIGVKYVDDDHEEPRGPTPRHEFVLLKSVTRASGLAPAVWIYNKLTGADKEKGGSGYNSLTTVSYEESDGCIVFKANAFLSLPLTFPKFLIRILPSDKSVIEEKAGKSIKKTLDKDVSHSMEAYEKAYLAKLESVK